METKPQLSAKSSFFVNTFTIIFLAGLAVVCKLLGQPTASGFFTLVSFLCFSSRVWAHLSLKNVTFRLKASGYRFFPGQKVQVELYLKNNKLFPLVWAELIQIFPPDACLIPEEGVRTLAPEEASQEGYISDSIRVYQKRFSLLLWDQELRHPYTWVACRRGLYQAKDILLRSGDGLGLAQLELKVSSAQAQRFAVYPALQPVRTDLFLQNVWNCQNSGLGYMEDPTLLRSTRPYQAGDPFKRINWRMAALGLPLETNIQETLLPKNAHFVFDGESYQGPDPDPEAMEDALSLIASLVMDLEEKGVRCGLSLPSGQDQPPVFLSALKNQPPHELLFRLAAYKPLAPVLNTEGKISPPRPSLFEETALAAAQTKGERIYYIARSGHLRLTPACRRLLDNGALLLVSDPDVSASAWRPIPLSQLKGGA